MMDLVIGIPSYNESDSIKKVTEVVDCGIRKYFPNLQSVIVNADNDSEDNTKEAFLSSQTITDKIYINTGKNPAGKGKNVLKLIEFANKNNAKAIVLFDADVTSIKGDWVHKLASPILSSGFDLVTPLYRRNRMEGNTTNHLMYPYIYAIYGTKVQQPIGGEFALSKKLYRLVQRRNKYESVFQYGIDIFITALAIKNNFKLEQVYLGRKAHKPSFSKQRNISYSELNTLFNLLIEDQKSIYSIGRKKTINLIDSKILKPQKDLIYKSYLITESYIKDNKLLLQKNFSILDNDFFKKNNYRIFINEGVWVGVLADGYKILNKENLNTVTEQIGELLLCRIYKFWIDIEGSSRREVDEIIQNQAEQLRNTIITYRNQP